MVYLNVRRGIRTHSKEALYRFIVCYGYERTEIS